MIFGPVVKEMLIKDFFLILVAIYFSGAEQFVQFW